MSKLIDRYNKDLAKIEAILIEMRDYAPYLNELDPAPTHTSNGGINLIKEFEGYRSKAYRDPAGIWTIGYGHTKGVKPGQVINKATGEKYLRSDLQWAENAVKSLVKVPLNQNQFDALVSFVYNLGKPNFSKSTLLRKLNQGNYNGAANEFGRWVYAGKKKLNGLIRRRAAEKALFLKKV